jgi:MFS family permease
LATSEAGAATGVAVQEKPKRIAAAVIAGHTFQHMYADGFLVLLPSIYIAFGLNPLTAGALATVRQSASGLSSMGGGFLIDMFAGKRGVLLAGALFMMGVGYLLAAAASNYVLLLLALALGSAAASFWHPVGLGILSASFPTRRAFMMALHRSAGGVGETGTPLLVAAALVAISWREVLVAGFLLMTAVSLALLVLLSRLGLGSEAKEKRSAGAQFGSIKELFQDRALPSLLVMSGVRGMADRALILFLPLFIMRELGADDVGNVTVAASVAFYLALMSFMSILVPPVIGLISDKIGRKPVMLVTLVFTAVITGLLWNVADPDGPVFGFSFPGNDWSLTVQTLGWTFTGLVLALGAVRFATNNLAQAASLDIAEGRRLEGSMIGLLWGNNAFFGAFSPLLLGGLIIWLGGDHNEFEIMFPYAAVMTVVALFAAFFLPADLGRPKATQATS